jgi:hypothetical protein
MFSKIIDFLTFHYLAIFSGIITIESMILIIVSA